MEDYTGYANKIKLQLACKNMLKAKFDRDLTDFELEKIVNDTQNDIQQEYNNVRLKLNELNNITLTNIKNNYQNIDDKRNIKTNLTNATSVANVSTVTTTTNVNKIDVINDNLTMNDDIINIKLKELEERRKIIPEYPIIEDNLDTDKTNQKNIIYKTNPISINIPSGLDNKLTYKSIIINSLNRDWVKTANRNNIKCNVSIDIENNVIYPYCLCLPKFVKSITPYVIMNISDGTKNILYTFICKKIIDKWDMWFPIDDAENILLSAKAWSIKLYDFTNNELKLGYDDMNVLEVSQKNNLYILKLKCSNIYDIINANDTIKIHTYSGRIYTKNIIYSELDQDNIFIHISNDNDDIYMEEFINSKILLLNNQYSFIVKYTNKKL